MQCNCIVQCVADRITDSINKPDIEATDPKIEIIKFLIKFEAYKAVPRYLAFASLGLLGCRKLKGEALISDKLNLLETSTKYEVAMLKADQH